MSSAKTRSLTRQTIAIVLGVQIACAALLCGAAIIHERHTLIRSMDVRLQGRSDSLLGAIQDAEDVDDNVTIDPAELNLPGQDVYAVYNRGGRLLGSSPNAPPALIARSKDEFRNVRAGDASYRVLQREGMRIIDRADHKGVGLSRPVTILYASPARHIWHETLEAVSFWLTMIVIASALAVFLVAIFLRRALRPLADLAQAAGHLSAPALQFEAPSSALQVKELRPLAEVLTDTVARLREAFAKEQRFLGDAAHELKTAIAVIRSSVQVLMIRRRTEDEYSAGLERVFEDTQRAEAIIAQMLELASVEESAAASAAAVDLGQIAGSVAERLQPIAANREVEIRLQITPHTHVRLSRGSAEILVSNLLFNAIQHSNPTSSVILSVLRDASSGIRLAVEDHGNGIGPDALPHIFERFYREDTSRSRETGGTGLGLAICKSIVDAAGATIQVHSTPHVGTRVEVVFSPA